MITIDWGLFVLMLAGTATLSTSMGMILAHFISWYKTTIQKRVNGLCGRCRAVKCDVCKTEGIYMGYEERKK